MHARLYNAVFLARSTEMADFVRHGLHFIFHKTYISGTNTGRIISRVSFFLWRHFQGTRPSFLIDVVGEQEMCLGIPVGA